MKAKVLVALSGGVDSAVSALLLKKQGYDVVGAFMVNYDDKNHCWRKDYQDALRIAAKLNIPLYKFNFVSEYKKYVLNYMYAEYERGRTPNPDVMCNKFVKFGFWLDKATELGFDFLATGHYALNKNNNNKYKLYIPKDKKKDQTYFLHQLSQKQLSKILFPVGDYLKTEIKEIAKQNTLGLENKKESMGICFIGEVDMVDFLKNKIKNQKPGLIIKLETQEIIGQHQGLAFYTRGQRHGFKQFGGDKPLFVIKKDFVKNILYVGYADNPELFETKIQVEQVNWIDGEEPNLPLKCYVRCRHGQDLQTALISKEDNNIISVEFLKPQRALASGQFAVFYLKSQCLGGGIIK